MLLAAAAWALRAYTPDDAFISFSFAQRRAAGDGWVASAGLPPVEGFSSPLWVGLLIVAAHVGADLVMCAKLLGVVSGVLLVLATAALAEAVRERSDWGAWAGPVLLATWPPLALWTVSGMENALYGFLLVAGTLGVVREVWGGRRGARSAWWWVAAIWTRPEAFGLAAVAAVWRLSAWRVSRRSTLAWCAVVVGGVGALVVWRYATFGEWLPNTFYAKRNNLLIGNGARYLGQTAWQAGFGVLAALAVIPLLVRGRAQTVHHPVLLLASLVLAQAVFIVQVGGDWMHQFRFVTPLAPFAAVLAGVGAAHLATGVARITPRLAVAVVMVGAALWAASWPAAWRGVRGHRSVDIAGAAWAPYRSALHGMAAALGPRARVVIPELGYPSFVTELRVLDPLGLASLHVAHLRYERVDRLVRDVWRPDAIKLHSLVREALALDRNRWFRDGYLLVGAPPDARDAPQAVDGWYVRRDLFERDAADLPPASAVFGEVLELRERTIEPPVVRPGQRLQVRLTWLPTAPPGDWVYELHLRSPAGAVTRQRRAPLHSWARTVHWKPGTAILDQIPLVIDQDLPSGTYDVGLVLQDANTAAPVPLGGASDGADPGPLSIGHFEVVRALPANRVDALQAVAQQQVEAGDWMDAWRTLAPARAVSERPPALDSQLGETAWLLTDRAADEATAAAEAGDFHVARAALTRAHGYAAPEWPPRRAALVEKLLAWAVEGRAPAPDGVSPDEPVSDSPIDPWRRIQLAGLALHADPTSRRAERLVRRLWRERAAAERAARRRAGATWGNAGRGPFAGGAARADTGVKGLPRIAIAEGVVRFHPPLFLDQLQRMEITLAGLDPAGPWPGTAHVLQLGYAGSMGYRVASVPVPLSAPTAAMPDIRLGCVRRDDRFLLRVRADGRPPVRYPWFSLAPNPWGAPHYPPQTPVLETVAVLALPAGAAPRLRPIRRVELEVGPSAEFAGSAPPAADARPAWDGTSETRPAITEYRPYERLVATAD